MTDKEKIAFEAGKLNGRIGMAGDLAIWRSGERLVGVMERPLKEFIRKDLDEYVWLMEKLGFDRKSLYAEYGVSEEE